MADESRWREDRDRPHRYEGRGRDERERHGRAGEDRWRESGRRGGHGDDDYSRQGSERRQAYGREGGSDIYGGDYGRERWREGFGGRGFEDRGYGREARAYSREDYGGSGYGGGYGHDDRDQDQGRGGYGRSRERPGGFASDDFAQEAYGQGFVGNEGRGFGYGSDYGRGGSGRYGGTGYGGGDDRRPGFGNQGHAPREHREERGFWQRASDEVASWFGSDEAERRREQDYRGRGPKGYRRSDARIHDDVSDRLADDPYVDASDIEVGVQNGEVTLSGTVDSRQARRRAEDIAESVSGVSYVQNNLRVRQQGGSAAGGHGTTGGTTGGTSAGAGDAPRAGGLGESIAYAAETGSNATGRSSNDTGSSGQTGSGRSGT
jgi:osmotically-inducible protein OsmY